MAAKSRSKPQPFQPDRPSRRSVRKPSGQSVPAVQRPAATSAGSAGRSADGSQVIPPEVANRMARRIAVAAGGPSLLGMGVFVASYLLVSRGLLEIAPILTLATSGACFLLGLLGLSYGVLSASWEPQPGSLLGLEQIGLNLGRVRGSIRAMRQGGANGG